MLYDLYYLDIYVHIAYNSNFVASEAMVASKWPQWPQNSNLTSDLKLATSITLVSMCMLPLMAVYMASEAMMAPKQPQR